MKRQKKINRGRGSHVVKKAKKEHSRANFNKGNKYTTGDSMAHGSDDVETEKHSPTNGPSGEAITEETQASPSEIVTARGEDATEVERQENPSAEGESGVGEGNAGDDAGDDITGDGAARENTTGERIVEGDIRNSPVVKRKKSHRPSLEVVEVKIDAFYERGDFKQDLQVGVEERKNCPTIKYPYLQDNSCYVSSKLKTIKTHQKYDEKL